MVGIVITAIGWITVISLRTWYRRGRSLRTVIPFRTRCFRFGLIAKVTRKTNSGRSSSRRAVGAIGTLVSIETTVGERTKAPSRAEMAVGYVASSCGVTECSIWTRDGTVRSVWTILTHWTRGGGVI